LLDDASRVAVHVASCLKVARAHWHGPRRSAKPRFPYVKCLSNERKRAYRYSFGMATETILLVDDDREIRQLLKAYLEQSDFVVSTAANAAEMFSHLATTVPSIIILDVMMPGQDGVAALRQLRQMPAISRVPVLMLTALGEPLERSRGLEYGADDYLGKPFMPRELLARINAVLRRTSGVVGNGTLAESQVGTADADSRAPAQTQTQTQAPTQTHTPRRRYFPGWIVDLDRLQVFAESGGEVVLTGAEFRLLVAFTDRPQRVLSREALLELTHSDAAESFDRSVDVLVSRLRNKLGDTARQPRLIRTVRGGGYMFLEPISTAPIVSPSASS
jgi:two-component system, OmpR family, response regulator